MFLFWIAITALELSRKENQKIISTFRYSKLSLLRMKILMPTGHNGLI